jgi:hypothetical protein
MLGSGNMQSFVQMLLRIELLWLLPLDKILLFIPLLLKKFITSYEILPLLLLNRMYLLLLLRLLLHYRIPLLVVAAVLLPDRLPTKTPIVRMMSSPGVQIRIANGQHLVLFTKDLLK